VSREAQARAAMARARAMKRAMRQRREEIRHQLRAFRREARDRVRQLPAVRKVRARKRARNAILLALLALGALFARCDCQRAPETAVETKVPEPPEPVKAPGPKPVKPGPLRASGTRISRPQLANESRAAPPWMEEYRLQVAARSPRLAQCFHGADRPGALRWTASVSPKNGIVSEHELEPIGGGSDLRREQRECLLTALSTPPYRLTAPGPEALPDRVGLVIEF